MTLERLKMLLNISDNYVSQASSVSPIILTNRDATLIGVEGCSSYKTSKAWDDYLTVTDASSSASTSGYTVKYKYNHLDKWLDWMLYQVEYDLIAYLNNHFHDGIIRLVANNLNFYSKTSSSPARITHGDSFFTSRGFATGMAIYVEGYVNSGLFHVKRSTDDELQLSTQEDLTRDTRGYGYEIERVNWPQEFEKIIAQIVGFHLARIGDVGLASKSMGPISVSYEGLESGGYPPSLYRAISKYRNLEVV
jgi:hypothetical protein